MIKEIKGKYAVSDDFIKFLLDYYSKRNKVDLESKKGKKKVIKGVRKLLHKLVGQYQIKKGHRSFIERKYEGLYEKIFSITGRVKSIVDIGCGLNPLSLKEYTYYAFDVDLNALKKIKEYFVKNKIKGKVEEKNFFVDFEYPKADLALLFKILRLIDFKGHKNAEKLIKNLKVKWIIASFSTRTLSGKKMNYPRVGWLERLLNRLKFRYEKFFWNNEIFYVIKKDL